MCNRGYIQGTNILEDCLACGAAMSEEVDDIGERLYCTEKHDYVEEDYWCEKYR
jgi:hypothetical protein